MTFLNPLVLFGLAAAAIPLILHLLNLRKLRTVEFSTLAFLKELQRTSIRRLKLRQILLLIIRTLLIIAIIVAFARPALRGSLAGTIGTHARTSAIVLLDDSFSMSATDERGELFAQAKDAARQILKLLKDGDDVSLLKMSELHQAVTGLPANDFSQIEKVIEESAVSFASGSMEDAMRMCAKALGETKNVNKEVFILSDFQQTLFPSARERVSMGVSEDIFPPQTNFFLMEFGAKGARNAAIDSVAIVSQILEKEKPATVAARIRNYSDIPLRDHVASVYFDGARVAQRNVDLPAWGSAMIHFTVVPKRSGFIGGYVAIEDDLLEHDNIRHIIASVPEKKNVALVSPSSEDVRFISHALGTGLGEARRTVFQITTTTHSQFPLLDLTKFDIIVLSNVPSFSTSDVSRIQSFVQQGGGVMIFPGNAVQVENYNALLLPALGIPGFKGRNGVPGSTQSSLAFQNIDTDHPIFTGVFEADERGKQSKIESPNVYVSMQRPSGKQGRTIISLSDRTPFLTEYRSGEGTALMFSSAPHLSWTDFPLKGLFAPLMYRAALYVSVQSDQPESYIIGESPTLRVKLPRGETSFNASRRYLIHFPDATEELVQPQTQTTPVGSWLVFPHIIITQPGIHEIRSAETVLIQFTANVDARESDLRKMGEDEREKFFAAFGVSDAQIHALSSRDSFEPIVLQSRFGVELWKYFIIAALILAVAEMAIARDRETKQKAGTTTVSD